MTLSWKRSRSRSGPRRKLTRTPANFRRGPWRVAWFAVTRRLRNSQNCWRTTLRGILLTRDELNGWLASFTRYKDSTDLPCWLEMHRAGAFLVDRKTGQRTTLMVEHAAVSVTGGIQPGVLARAVDADFLDAGLGACLLMAMPNRKPKRWSEVEVHPDCEAPMNALSIFSWPWSSTTMVKA